MISKILVGLGANPYADGPTHAAIDLARRFDAQLTGVTVANFNHLENVGPVPIGAGAVASELRSHRLHTARTRIDAAVANFTAACERACVDSHVLSEERSEPFDYLISQARYHDLAVMGLHGLFEYGIEGERTYDQAESLMHLVRGGVRPLLAVGEEHREVRRVLIAYSGSIGSAKTMKRFVQMALWPEARVRVVSFGEDLELCEQHLYHAAQYCRSHRLEVETSLERGDPRYGVLEAADEWEADLIVMGNCERTLLARRVLGDTLLETVRHTDLPLFLAQ